MNRPQIVVFDLDGTLVDSAPTIGDVLNGLRADRDLLPLPVQAYRAWISQGASKLVGAALGLQVPATPEMVNEFRRCYAAAKTTAADLYPGVEITLATLAQAGIPMGICSNKPHALCEKVLADIGIRRYFAAVSGGDSVQRSKPHPMHLRQTLASMRCVGQPFFFVGDSLIDAQASSAADGVFLWASYGYSDSDELARLGQRLESAHNIAPAILANAKA